MITAIQAGAFASSLRTGAFLADRLGRRRTILLGLLILTIGIAISTAVKLASVKRRARCWPMESSARFSTFHLAEHVLDGYRRGRPNPDGHWWCRHGYLYDADLGDREDQRSVISL